jgi:hypothetical protein
MEESLYRKRLEERAGRWIKGGALLLVLAAALWAWFLWALLRPFSIDIYGIEGTDSMDCGSLVFPSQPWGESCWEEAHDWSVVLLVLGLALPPSVVGTGLVCYGRALLAIAGAPARRSS